ncbi:Poly(A) RNA polymerase cid14 [Termitomyces sp. J132]|nr:Poly(A) RNA polymerase cid14 [Termitomyces sp. J132]
MTSPFESLEEFRETPWMNIFKKESTYNGPEHRLHHEILAYLMYMQQTPDEKRARELVMTEIRRVVHGRFYGAEIRLYGSSATGLCLPTSDIGVAIKLPRITEADVKRTLFQLSSQFRPAALTSNVFVNHHAKVPILIFLDPLQAPSIDININDESGTRGVEVINGYLAQMPALRPLVLLLKGFLHQKRLSDAPRGALGSYALVCLCIHFLQANPSNRPQEYIDKPMESESLGFLLIDFMFYYGLTFDYATSYVSSATSPGRLLPLTEENEVLSIRCLFNPENEIAKSVNKVRAFFQGFKDAYSTLLQLNLMDQTMLGQIIRLDQKV